MNSSNKIIYHHRTRGVGAEGVHIRGIVSALREKDFSVDIISFPGTDPEEQPKKPQAAPRKSLKKTVLENVARMLPQAAFEILEIFYNFVTLIRLSKRINKDVLFVYERYSLFLNASSARLRSVISSTCPMLLTEPSGLIMVVATISSRLFSPSLRTMPTS